HVTEPALLHSGHLLHFDFAATRRRPVSVWLGVDQSDRKSATGISRGTTAIVHREPPIDRVRDASVKGPVSALEYVTEPLVLSLTAIVPRVQAGRGHRISRISMLAPPPPRSRAAGHSGSGGGCHRKDPCRGGGSRRSRPRRAA